MPTAVVILSGGMDSSVLAFHYATLGFDVHCLSFDYGQRHVRELDSARAIAARLSAPHHVIDLTSVTGLLKGSALTDPTVPVPHGHYAADTMKATVVPNRNAMMLAVAYAYAVACGAQVVGFGAHTGDHTVYPDCREEFVDLLSSTFRVGNEGHGDPGLRIEAPFVNMSKTAIAAYGAGLAVPYALTWSCYEGGAIHCGRCGTCTERREAFTDAGVPDPTDYAP